ncbi:MAG: hypothetical protein MUF84_02145 [Anaerolineae bacterium]|jgi:hypothetical protein|nr:hypothetical protein [Anaerolineae bacterium]
MIWSTSDPETVAQLGSFLAREYARPFLALLATYQDVSASEAASRLGLHIRTAQDFLEGLAVLGIAGKTEVHEGKRPYFRYTLLAESLMLTLDLTSLRVPHSGDALDARVRERLHARADFVAARGDSLIGNVTLWSGNGRERKQHRISLTDPQGRFLFHLPFPDAEPLTIAEIMCKAGLDRDLAPEILDIVTVLAEHEVVEVLPG